MPNPETIDPIYKDLVSHKKKLESEISSRQAELNGLKEKLAKAEPQSFDIKVYNKQIEIISKRLAKIHQEREYYRIRAERRRVEGRREYLIRYQKGEKWPDPKEFEVYLQHKKLSNASKNWSERVPKFVDRYTKDFKHPDLMPEEEGQ